MPPTLAALIQATFRSNGRSRRQGGGHRVDTYLTFPKPAIVAPHSLPLAYLLASVSGTESTVSAAMASAERAPVRTIFLLASAEDQLSTRTLTGRSKWPAASMFWSSKMIGTLWKS